MKRSKYRVKSLAKDLWNLGMGFVDANIQHVKA